MDEKNLPNYEITHKVIGCAMKVHSALKNGFPEVIYQKALDVEMKSAGIAFLREYDMPVYYKNEIVGRRRVDFLVQEIIPVELKAVSTLENSHIAQA